MERNCYIDITQSMLSNDLTPKELITFALIHSHSKDTEGCFYGSLKYIANWLNIRGDKVCSILNSLCRKNLITKEKVSTLRGERCRYRTNIVYNQSECESKIRIYSYMTSLNLKARELLLFALIDGYSHKKHLCYIKKGSEIAMWLGINPKHISRYVNKLVGKNLVAVTPEGYLTSLSLEAYRTALDNVAGISSTTPCQSFSSGSTKMGMGVTNLGDNNIINNNDLKKENILNNTSISNICSAGSVIEDIVSKSQYEKEYLETFGLTEDLEREGLKFLEEAISHYSGYKRKKLLEMSEKNARYLYNLSISLMNSSFDRFFGTIKSKIAFTKAQLNKILANSNCYIYRNNYKLACEFNELESSFPSKHKIKEIPMPVYPEIDYGEVDLEEIYARLRNC